jgi:hypothetical protein
LSTTALSWNYRWSEKNMQRNRSKERLRLSEL